MQPSDKSLHVEHKNAVRIVQNRQLDLQKSFSEKIRNHPIKLKIVSIRYEMECCFWKCLPTGVKALDDAKTVNETIGHWPHTVAVGNDRLKHKASELGDLRFV